MTAGNIGVWQKKVGDAIAPGDVLVEIETDKAQMDFEFQEEGTIAAILRDAGAKDVAVGSVSHSTPDTTHTGETAGAVFRSGVQQTRVLTSLSPSPL